MRVRTRARVRACAREEGEGRRDEAARLRQRQTFPLVEGKGEYRITAN